MKILRLLLLLLIALSTAGFGQSVELDSLKSLLVPGIIDTTQVDILNWIAFKARYVDKDTSAVYLEKARLRANDIDYYGGIARNMNIESMKLINEKKHLEFVDANKKALAVAEKGDNLDARSNIYVSLGYIYFLMVQYDKSLEAFFIALDYSKRTKDNKVRSIILTNIIAVHLVQKNYSLAEGYINELKTLGIEQNSSRVLHVVNTKLGESFFLKKEYDKAIQHYEQALKNLEEGNLEKGEAKTRYKIIELLLEQNRMEEAIQHLNKNIFTKYAPEKRAVKYYYLNAVYQLKQHKYKESIAYARKSIEKSNRNKRQRDIIPKAYEVIEQAAGASRNYQMAYEAMKERSAWEKQHEIKGQKEKIINMENLYQYEKKEIENKLLKEEKSKNEALLRQKSITAYAAMLCSLLLIALVVLLYRSYRIKMIYNKKLEQKVIARTQILEQTNSKLVQSNSELERFAYIASHDLKEPLRNINSFTQLIRRRYSKMVTGEFDEFLEHIQNNIYQMKFLIEGILEYSRLEENFQTETVDVSQTLLEVKSYLNNTFKKKNARLEMEDIPTIQNNKVQLFQVFKNLIHNGLKFNEHPHPSIHITYQEDEQQHHFFVSDNGIGIPVAYQGQIFNMFTRLHNRSAYEGAGLGLAIVSKIVESQQGAIELVNSSESGTTFKISLAKVVYPTSKQQPFSKEKIESALN